MTIVTRLFDHPPSNAYESVVFSAVTSTVRWPWAPCGPYAPPQMLKIHLYMTNGRTSTFEVDVQPPRFAFTHPNTGITGAARMPVASDILAWMGASSGAQPQPLWTEAAEIERLLGLAAVAQLPDAASSVYEAHQPRTIQRTELVGGGLPVAFLLWALFWASGSAFVLWSARRQHPT